MTFDTEFALPIICQPFIEKDRQNRSFGERDFQSKSMTTIMMFYDCDFSFALMYFHFHFLQLGLFASFSLIQVWNQQNVKLIVKLSITGRCLCYISTTQILPGIRDKTQNNWPLLKCLLRALFEVNLAGCSDGHFWTVTLFIERLVSNHSFSKDYCLVSVITFS